MQSNEDGDLCIKCSGILSSVEDDECVCEGPKAVFSKETAGLCECNADDFYQISEDETDCIRCFGIGSSIVGNECVCDPEMNAEMSQDEEGF